MSGSTTYAKGLEGVVAGKTSICFIDGVKGTLIYRGYDIADLAEHSTFEETAFLLWFGKLPNQEELKDFQKSIDKNLVLDEKMVMLLRNLDRAAHPMAVLRTAVSFLGCFDRQAQDNTISSVIAKATNLLAMTPVIVANYERLRNSKDRMPPVSGKSLAWNFLYMLNGTEPDPEMVKTLDVILILHADHEFNASTFTARVCISTWTDVFSAVTGAIGALKGPLHGGAPLDVMTLLEQIQTVDKVEKTVAEMFAAKKKVPGFGHRVYKTYDPRAVILRKFAENLGRKSGNLHWYEMTKKLEDTVIASKKIYPNVDLYSPACYACMGIPKDLYTCMFAISRMSGWCAHIMEQINDNRIMRPLAEYTGKMELKYVPLDKR